MARGRIVREQTTNKVHLPIIGKIKLGEKVKNASGTLYPTSLDYFKADPLGRYAETFHRLLGEKPTKLRISFISDDYKDVCDERWECWDNGKVRGFKYGFGDGNVFSVYSGALQRYVEYKADDPELKKHSEGFKWKSTLTLRFVVLDIPGVMGVWQLTTRGSKSSIPDIINTFDTVLDQAGTIRGLPFDLVVQKVSGRSLGLDGGIQTTNFPVVTLVPNFTEANIMAVKNYLEKGGDPNKVALLTMNINKVEQLSNADITINHGQAQLGEGEAKQERASQSPEGDQA